MEVQPDFRDLLELFNKHDVQYMMVGGYALAFHGASRFTGDMDLFVKPGVDNSKKIITALAEFGFQFSDLQMEDFQNPDKIIQLGVPPVRVDVLTSISGVSWEEADKGKIHGKYGDQPCFYIGKKRIPFK
jgi:hypothetical protein